MAVLTTSRVGERLNLGSYVMMTIRTSAIGTAQAAEWVVTGLGWIDAVIGVVVIGATTSATALSVQLNARGTGVAEGTNPGDLGIETATAGTNVVEITVVGRA